MISVFVNRVCRLSPYTVRSIDNTVPMQLEPNPKDRSRALESVRGPKPSMRRDNCRQIGCWVYRLWYL